MTIAAPPATLPVLVEHIPAELKLYSQWVGWTLERRDGKWTKPPVNARSGKSASSTDPETWSRFDEATAVLGHLPGIGFVLTREDPFTGLDLDKCRDLATEAIDPWAQAIIDQFQTYTEVSPSGTGVRLFFRGRMPGDGRRKGALEVYARARYLTTTGHHVAGTPTKIEDRQAELDALLAEHFTEPVVPTNGHHVRTPVDLADTDLLERARGAKHGDRLRALYDAGDWSGAGYTSQSEADLALAHDLLFWTNGDVARADRLFRAGALMRDKWISKHGDRTYGAITLDKALASLSEGYSGSLREPRPSVDVDANVLEEPITPRAPSVIVTPAPGFIGRYVAVAEQRTDAPTTAHQLAAVGLLSALAGPRVRLRLAYRADGVRLVIWTMNLVDSTSGRKTTVLEFALDTIRHVLGESAVLPWKGSPEALIQNLAARDGAASVFARDEYSGLLAQMKRGGYVAGLAQDFIRAYDGLPIVMARTAKMSRKTGERVDDTDRVRDPYLVKLCAATRTEFIATATIDDVLDGLLARFVFTTGSAEEQRMRPMTRTLEDAWRKILEAAAAYHAQAADVLEIGLPEQVLDREWALEQRLKASALASGRPDAARPAMKRLAETVLKVAALLALERAAKGSATITEWDWDAAEALAAPWEQTTLAVVADIGRTRFQARSDAVLGTIRAHPKGIMLSALYRAHRDLAQREFDEVLGALETQQLVHSVEAKTGKPGRTPVVYFPGPTTEPA